MSAAAAHMDPKQGRFSDGFVEQVKSASPILDVVASYLELKKRGGQHWACCPFHRERTPSFSVSPTKGIYKCFGCGEGGDALAFVQAIEGASFPQAVDLLAVRAGLEIVRDDAGEKPAQWKPKKRVAAKPAPKDDAGQVRLKVGKALAIWEQGEVIKDSPVEAYLAGRGIKLDLLPEGLASLKYHPALKYWDSTGDHPRDCGDHPAMLAAIVSPERGFLGVHCTYLAANGAGKLALTNKAGEKLGAKKVRGAPSGGVIRLFPSAPKMGLAEGIETALSVAQSCDLSVWCAYSLNNLVGPGKGRGYRHPEKDGQYLPSTDPDMTGPCLIPPEMCRDLTLCADADTKDLYAAQALMRRGMVRYRRLLDHVTTMMPDAGKDFNDMLQKP